MANRNGLLLIDKPRGLTSHDVVARVRRILGERRVGHAGTLDPMATGLLVIAVGPSTRLLRFAQAETKRYSGAVCFGIATDSLDADGTETERRAVPDLDEMTVQLAADAMLGAQSQIPPMVSALKVNGQRLHALAREGVEVERAPRSITVSDFRLAATGDPAVWTFSVTCSVGTYVRVLLADLAVRLGTVGHLVALRREASGNHEVTDALSLEELARRVEAGMAVLSPPSAFVTALVHVQVSESQELALRRGQQVDLVVEANGGEIAAARPDGQLVGVLRRRGERWQPELILPAADAR